MFLNEKYKDNILLFVTFLKKNTLIILLTTVIFTSLGFLYIKKNDTYSLKLELILNLEAFNETKLYPSYVFESKEFNDYLHEHLKDTFVTKKPSKNSKKEATIKDHIEYFPSEKGGDPYMSLIYTNTSEKLVENFEDNFIKLANDFFTSKKNILLDEQIKKLQSEYINLKNETTGTDITTDPQVTSIIAKLTYWRTLKNQPYPMMTLIQSEVYPTLNKKLILIFSFLIGLLFGSFIALIKETIKDLNAYKIIKREG